MEPTAPPTTPDDTSPTPLPNNSDTLPSLPSPPPPSLKKLLLLLTIPLLFIVLASASYYRFRHQPLNPLESDLGISQVTPTPTLPIIKTITEPQLLFTGGYADPTIIKQSETKLIMYLNNFTTQPSKYQAYSSTDGLKWQLIPNTKLPTASTGRAVKFTDRIRLYYPDLTPIKPTDPPASILSAISSNGTSFTKETGKRIDPQSGHYLEGPTVIQLPDQTYRMYFSENETASAEKRISQIWGATSPDGLAWTRDTEVTLQADDTELASQPEGGNWSQMLHPFILTHDNGTYLMFYNTHSEVYLATSTDGLTWTKQGRVNIHGADVDGYFLDDHTIRLYYGDFSPETKGVIYTIDLQINLPQS